MDFFDKYSSATVAAANNQAKYRMPDRNERVSRSYLRSEITADAEFSVLMGDTIDSTFELGDLSGANMVCGNWEITGMRIGIADRPGAEPSEMKVLTIDGRTEKKVSEGEVFWTDAAALKVRKGEYFCVEIAFRGEDIPILFETVFSSYNKGESEWYRDIFLPVPNMVGCAGRNVPRVCFWGDSITQGLGTDHESYSHYGAVVADILGERCAYWDIGIGYARAADAATCGAWMNKAKHNDIVTVCFGVNDINFGADAEGLKKSLDTVVSELKKAGCKVIIQSIPPFDFTGGAAEIWDEVNGYIRNELSLKCDGYFDNNSILCDGEDHTKVIYGKHPDARGHLLWGRGLAEEIRKLL